MVQAKQMSVPQKCPLDPRARWTNIIASKNYIQKKQQCNAMYIHINKSSYPHDFAKAEFQ